MTHFPFIVLPTNESPAIQVSKIKLDKAYKPPYPNFFFFKHITEIDRTLKS